MFQFKSRLERNFVYNGRDGHFSPLFDPEDDDKRKTRILRLRSTVELARQIVNKPRPLARAHATTNGEIRDFRRPFKDVFIRRLRYFATVRYVSIRDRTISETTP